MTEISEFTGEYRFLSNFAPSPIEFEGIWPTVEHLYQAMKTDSWLKQEEIRLLDTPGQAKKAGRKVRLRADWEETKLDIMLTCLRMKFEQNPDLRERLLATGDATLIEGNWWGDTFWGVCRGKGDNHLGKLLMTVRETIDD